MSTRHPHHRRWRTAITLILPLLYLQQLAPHHHAAPEAAPAASDHHAAAPHHHTHDHHHHGEPDQPAEAHHHHTLAAHLDLHAPPAVPTGPGDESDQTLVVAPTAPETVQPGHGLRPPAAADPPPLLRPASPAVPRGPPRRA